MIGSKMSCIAVCEIIDDDSVKCKVHGELQTAKLVLYTHTHLIF